MIGEKVRHRRFGTGTIVSHDESAIFVKFDSQEKKTQFSATCNICDYLFFDNPELERALKESYAKRIEVKKREGELQAIDAYIQSSGQKAQHFFLHG